MQTEAYFQFTFIWLHSFICRAQCEIKISSCVTWRDGCVDACQNIAQMDNLIFRSLQFILKYLDESKSYCDWSKVETGFGYHHYGAHCEQIDANAVFRLFNCSWILSNNIGWTITKLYEYAENYFINFRISRPHHELMSPRSRPHTRNNFADIVVMHIVGFPFWTGGCCWKSIEHNLSIEMVEITE